MTTNRKPIQLLEVRLRAHFLAGLNGDSAAYDVFLDDLRSHLHGYLVRHLPRTDSEVEDILQEILLAVHTARRSYCRNRPLTAWAYGIARYKLVDHYRMRSRRAPFDVPLEGEPEPTWDAEAEYASRDIRVLLGYLPDRYRLPILHTKLHGLSVTETARLTGLSESAVKVGVHRGLKKLMTRAG